MVWIAYPHVSVIDIMFVATVLNIFGLIYIRSEAEISSTCQRREIVAEIFG